MVKLRTVLIFAFYTGSSSTQVAHKTFFFELFLIDVINSFYIDKGVFFLEVALRHPNCAYIMNPNEMASWLIIRICCF